MREGYWETKLYTGEKLSNLPMPVPYIKRWIGKAEFLAALTLAEDKASQAAYKGSSVCRICGQMNGSRDFRLDDWQWPSGYRHYIEEHDVRPSLAFEEFILGREIR